MTCLVSNPGMLQKQRLLRAMGSVSCPQDSTARAEQARVQWGRGRGRERNTQLTARCPMLLREKAECRCFRGQKGLEINGATYGCYVDKSKERFSESSKDPRGQNRNPKRKERFSEWGGQRGPWSSSTQGKYEKKSYRVSWQAWYSLGGERDDLRMFL